MRTDKLKKYLLPNLPYLFIAWACLKVGTAYRLAAGADLAHKLVGMVAALGPAFADFAPGLEIYLLTSLAPIPVATLSNREVGGMGQNYLKSLFAVGFQGMLILVCVGIYAVLVQNIAAGGDPIGAIWGTVGYTVLLCFMLFKTGTISRSIFGAH